MIGCYAQTELGHGSNVAGIETTATYDPSSDQIVIHSPTTSSTKYWPGDMGIYANWAIVYAQLIANGKNFGVQPMMVQLRDMQTHELLPGIEAGDIGPKFGYNSKNNGYLKFTNVKIPRDFLLARYVELTKEGELKKKGDLRILYSVMMATRLSLIFYAGRIMQ